MKGRNMYFQKIATGFFLVMGVSLWNAAAATNPRYHLFLLFGQSNMCGAPRPAAQDTVRNPRVKAIAYNNCTNLGLGYNQVYTAFPPLHGCSGGLGPGDYFGKMMADSLPLTDTIGLIPCAIPGVDIEYFMKGVVSTRRNEFSIPPDNHWTGAYPFVMQRCSVAVKRGVIRGFLFHQGESDAPYASAWIPKVKGIVANLRADLNVPDAPFIAGELLYAQFGGACASLNTYINRIPDSIPHSYAVSASGLDGTDQFHFSLTSQRELGRRYARAMLNALRTTGVIPGNRQSAKAPALARSSPENEEIYALNGKRISFGPAAKNRFETMKSMRAGSVYLVAGKNHDGVARIVKTR
jgi:hypothetical protein